MGTTSQKLTYLNTTKQLLKTEINKINNVLDNNSTFRSYPQELFNGYLDILNNGTDTLWNNLEKVSASGEEATLENVETAPIKMVLNGNTSQDGEPTPDTPVEVKVVKGENVVSVSGKNLLNPSVARYNCNVNNDTGIITITTNATDVYIQGAYAYSEANKFLTLPSGNYYLKSTNPNVRITFYGDIASLNTSSQQPQKLNSETNFGGIRIRSNSSLQNVSFGILLSTTDDTYVPYSKTDYPINLVSKNLFSTENLVNATITDTGEYLTGDNRCTGDYVFLDKSQENLALSFNLNILFMGIAFYDENKQYLSRATINNTNLLTAPIPTNAEYCRPFFQFMTSPAAKIDAKIVQQLGTQLEYGTERTNYVSYFTPIELCKINTYKDFPFKAINGNEYYDTLTEEQKNALNYGSWYVHKAIGKVVLDGGESWNERTNAINVKQFYVSNTLPSIINTTQYCNYFAKYNGSNIYNYGGIGNFAILTNSRQFFGCVNSDLTLENFKTLLASNNLIVYYVLATPTEEEITNTTLIEQLEAINNAKSVKDKTYVTQTNDDLPFILDVEAIKEYEVN